MKFIMIICTAISLFIFSISIHCAEADDVNNAVLGKLCNYQLFWTEMIESLQPDKNVPPVIILVLAPRQSISYNRSSDLAKAMEKYTIGDNLDVYEPDLFDELRIEGYGGGLGDNGMTPFILNFAKHKIYKYDSLLIKSYLPGRPGHRADYGIEVEEPVSGFRFMIGVSSNINSTKAEKAKIDAIRKRYKNNLTLNTDNQKDNKLLQNKIPEDIKLVYNKDDTLHIKIIDEIYKQFKKSGISDIENIFIFNETKEMLKEGEDMGFSRIPVIVRFKASYSGLSNANKEINSSEFLFVPRLIGLVGVIEGYTMKPEVLTNVYKNRTIFEDIGCDMLIDFITYIGKKPVPSHLFHE